MSNIPKSIEQGNNDHITQYDLQQFILEGMERLNENAADLVAHLVTYVEEYGFPGAPVARRVQNIGKALHEAGLTCDAEYCTWEAALERKRAWEGRTNQENE